MIIKQNSKFSICTKDQHIRTHNVDVVVSMTTWKNRLIHNEASIITALTSIVNQKTNLKILIALNVFKDDKKYISNNLLKFLKDNFIVIQLCSINLRSHLKYFFTMLKYRDVPVITVDDDCKYMDNLVESLYCSYLKDKTCIYARRVHLITYENEKVSSYQRWKKEYTKITYPSFELFATGVGGVLYPPDILKIHYEDIKDICRSITADDIYLKYKETQLNIPVMYVKNQNKLSYEMLDCSVSEDALCNVNYVNNNTYISELPLQLRKDFQQTVNIAYITDQNYFFPAYKSIQSICDSVYSDVKYCISVVCDNVSLSDINKLRQLSMRNVDVHVIDASHLMKMHTTKPIAHVSNTALLKFELLKLFCNNDKVLYIDCDTLVFKDLSELYNTDITGYYLAAVNDINVNLRYKNDFHAMLRSKNGCYFNSGVMLLNMKKLVADDCYSKLVHYRLTGTNRFMDQDAFNAVLGKSVKLIAPKYNCFSSIFEKNIYQLYEIKRFFKITYFPSNSVKDIEKYCSILHFASPIKPWISTTSKFNVFYNEKD